MEIQYNGTTLEEIKLELVKESAIYSKVGFLTGKKEGEVVSIEGVYVPEQISTHHNTFLLNGALARDIKLIEETGKFLVGIIHYVGNLECDDTTVKIYKERVCKELNEKDLVGIVLNARGECKSI